MMRWQHAEYRKDKRNAYEVFVQEPNRKRPPGIPRSTIQDNIQIDL
jgi:hypothetical protein